VTSVIIHFDSHPKSIYWSYDKNECTPREVFRGTSKKYYFTCDKCDNEFAILLNGIREGKWCSVCKNKTEKKIFEELIEDYPTIEFQKKT